MRNSTPTTSLILNINSILRQGLCSAAIFCVQIEKMLALPIKAW